MKSQAYASLAITAVLFGPALLYAAPPDAPTSSKGPTTNPRGKSHNDDSTSESAILAQQLANPDASVQQKALDRIKELLAVSPIADDNEKAKKPFLVDTRWIKSLSKVHRYDDAEALAITGILQKPWDVRFMSSLQRLRVETFMDAGKHDAALSAAKGYYNICSMKDSGAAIDLVSLCLANAHPDDKGIVRRFKAQQVAAATTQPTSKPAAGEESILLSIVVDGKPFEGPIEALKLKNFDNLLAKGNFLLLSGKAKEAKDCFDLASDLAVRQNQIGFVTEALARAIRAEAGGIGAANAYVLKLQGGEEGAK